MAIKTMNSVAPAVKRPVFVRDLQDVWDGLNNALAWPSLASPRIISGFAISGTTIGPGVVSYGGKLYFKSTNTTLGAVHYGHTVESDNRIYFDGSTRPMSYDNTCDVTATGGTTNVNLGTFTQANIEAWVMPRIGTGLITTAMLADAIINNAKLADGSITTPKIVDRAITSIKIAVGGVTANELGSNAVTTVKILDANVTTAKIADNNVTTAKIATGAVTANELASNAVTTAKIADGNVTTAKIADGNVTVAKLASGAAVGNIGAGTITSTMIADNAVTTTKINAQAVTTAKIANSTITATQLADNAVTTAKINNSAVSTDKIADVAVTAGKIAGNAVNMAKIADGAISLAKLDSAIRVEPVFGYYDINSGIVAAQSSVNVSSYVTNAAWQSQSGGWYSLTLTLSAGANSRLRRGSISVSGQVLDSSGAIPVGGAFVYTAVAVTTNQIQISIRFDASSGSSGVNIVGVGFQFSLI